jgi:hypothetical protein
MSSSSEITDGMLIDLLNERGYDVRKRGEPDLGDKIDAVGQKLDEMRAEPASPEEQRVRFAEQLRDRMNESVTPWFTPGGDDA